MRWPQWVTSSARCSLTSIKKWILLKSNYPSPARSRAIFYGIRNEVCSIQITLLPSTGAPATYACGFTRRGAVSGVTPVMMG
ncbi:hypothetical protein CKO_00002 [Citrobacter koseri ATCC BAA-895]|uniref:Uncharacterized protein n=1 Tax=Citrobacter koseri (strain ATCC BAA-895 / CDC 4225-83 / SGSC4696) TaxID=290338 RepID=A8ACG8_CITK8|nr:hypothetical protein CKO_00002 [Citrobacter koseri ATCC BAA-895]